MHPDVNVKVSPPREGLPPCTRAAIFAGRMAVYHDNRRLCNPFQTRARYAVGAGAAGPVGQYEAEHTPPLPPTPGCMFEVTNCQTDDTERAEAAYTKACEWVRTGEL